jgi:integrase
MNESCPSLTPGWAPFKGSLSIASQQLALAALHSLFAWLVQARYLASNPWVLVNRKLGDDPRHDIGDSASRAFTPLAWTMIIDHLKRAPPTPSNERLHWICVFVEATGLRAAELIATRVEDFRHLAAGWVLKVHGKGRRNRTVPVPTRAIKATVAYLATRGLQLSTATQETPLLGSLTTPTAGVTYSALHETFTRFLKRALTALPTDQRRDALRASMHWLRHTHATRAAEANVSADVLQENLGQSDPRTTARYYRAQLERRQREMERAFGESS